MSEFDKLAEKKPQMLIAPWQLFSMSDSIEDLDRAGRIRIYKLCAIIENIMNQLKERE